MIKYKFSILIPSWNDEKYIENCVNSILENDYKNFKIILIAGGTGIDNSYELALYLQKKYLGKVIAIEQKFGNKNKALNQGLKETDGDIIVLTDIDCLYQKKWLTRINEIFQDKKYNIITSNVLPFPGQNKSLSEYNNITNGYNLIKCCKQGDVIIGNKLCGANSMFRKSVFLNEIEHFDESVSTGDDKILGMHFNQKGESLYYFQDIYVYSECFSNSVKNYIKHRIRWARDLYIIPLNSSQIIRLIFFFSIALFKLFYPFAVIFLWLIFFVPSIFWLILLFLPWIIFYLSYVMFFYFKLKIMSSELKNTLHMNFNLKRAIKIVPILFFAYSIITFISIINPKREKW